MVDWFVNTQWMIYLSTGWDSRARGQVQRGYDDQRPARQWETITSLPGGAVERPVGRTRRGLHRTAEGIQGQMPGGW